MLHRLLRLTIELIITSKMSNFVVCSSMALSSIFQRPTVIFELLWDSNDDAQEANSRPPLLRIRNEPPRTYLLSADTPH